MRQTQSLLQLAVFTMFYTFFPSRHIVAVDFSCLATLLLLGDGWFHTYVQRICLHPYTHESPDRTLITSNGAESERRMTRKGITYTALGGNFFLIIMLLRSIAGYALVYGATFEGYMYVDACRQDRILDL